MVKVNVPAQVRSSDEGSEQVDVLGEVAISEVLGRYTLPSGRSEPLGEPGVSEQDVQGRREGVKIAGVLDQQTIAPVGHLVLNSTDR